MNQEEEKKGKAIRQIGWVACLVLMLALVGGGGEAAGKPWRGLLRPMKQQRRIGEPVRMPAGGRRGAPD
jgi:hypothetical protein